jgi:glycosyltransferase involved in cell wall biosynthesis
MKNNNVKILEIGPYPPPSSGWAVRIKFVVDRLREEDCDCQVLNLGGNRQKESPDYITVLGGFDYLCKVFRYAQKGYLIHMHANGDSPKGFVLTLIALGLAFLFGKRAVLTFHAGPDQLFFPKRKSLILRPIFYLIFKLPQKIICNCNAVKEKIVEYGISPGKITPIPAFSEQYLIFTPVSYDPNLQVFMEKHDPIILSYLLFRPEFYHESVFECIKLLTVDYPQLGFLVVGGKPETSDNGQDVYTLVEKLGIENRTVFLGNISHDLFLTLIQDVDLKLRSASTEGICSSILESLYFKTPVVANKNDLHPNGVVQFIINDVEDMMQKVAGTLRNSLHWKKNTLRPVITDTVQHEVDLLKGMYEHKKVSQ